MKDLMIRYGKRTVLFLLILFIMPNQGCLNNSKQEAGVKPLIRLMVLDPGHFHAALLQKYPNPDVGDTVYVFAPEGPELKAYLSLTEQYNSRKDRPTSWIEKVYTGPDHLERMLREKPGNVVVIAGNNLRKTDNIKRSIEAGLNVLADKPMVINAPGFEKLKTAFTDAEKSHVLLYDIMTERYEIANILQKAFAHIPDVFGELQKGTQQDPAVIFESVHFFYKEVSGKPLIRPAWYFDTDQQGEGIVDVTTHLADLAQWECFPETVFNYPEDIDMLTARHWATVLTPAQFSKVTGVSAYPDFLQKEIRDSLLQVYANGEMNYTLKGIHVKISAAWKYEAPQGTGDTFYSMLRGTKASLVIRQDREHHDRPALYIEPAGISNTPAWEKSLEGAIKSIQREYPGVSLQKKGKEWEVMIPGQYHIGHEQQFALVVKKYLEYIRDGKMPEWEIAAMIAKYYTTTKALELARNADTGTTKINHIQKNK